MLVHFGIENIRPEWNSSTVVVGTFDGVHLGHRALIAKTTEEAKKREQPAVIVTFERHQNARGGGFGLRDSAV